MREHIITWVISCLALLVSLWSVYQSRPSLSAEIMNTENDEKSTLRKHQLFVMIQNLGNKLCRIKHIKALTMPLSSPDKSLKLNSNHYTLIKELSSKGYSISSYIDLPPNSKLPIMFDSSEVVHEGNQSWLDRKTIDSEFNICYAIEIEYRYIIPFTMIFVFEKNRSPNEHIGKFRLIHAEEKRKWLLKLKMTLTNCHCL